MKNFQAFVYLVWPYVLALAAFMFLMFQIITTT